MPGHGRTAWCARVGVRGGFLHVAERDPGVKRGCDERVPEGVGPCRLGQSGAAGDPAHEAPGAAPVERVAGRGLEDRSLAALAYGQVDRPRGARRERDDGFLAALAGNGQGAVAALDAEILDVGADGLGNPQPIKGEQGDQSVLGRAAQPGGCQESS